MAVPVPSPRVPEASIIVSLDDSELCVGDSNLKEQLVMSLSKHAGLFFIRATRSGGSFLG